jgi:S-sulfosulfanyl-L-cysteine sulfohydrolase
MTQLSRREFVQALGAAAAAGMALGRWVDADAASAERGLYDLPPFGNVSLLHFTDCHAQLLPLHYREPSVNIGAGAAAGRWPHLTGERLLAAAGLKKGSAEAHAFTHLDFERLARRYGRMGGFAHLATLVKRLKASRPGALLLDGGDTWQGSATALWTQGQDMVEAALALGVDIMTGHWEFTYGMARVQQLVKQLEGRIEFLAQNVKTADFEDPVFKAWTMRQANGVPVAVIGQAFPYTPIAHPRRFVADWTFGIREQDLQRTVDEARGQGAAVVALLSHNGMDVDLKLAGRVRGIDVIFGGHTHDAVPLAVEVSGTRVTNAGSNGKFVGVMDFDVRDGRIVRSRYRLLPVFSRQLTPDPTMAALIERLRAPHAGRLGEQLAVTEGLLVRRGNFNGSWDQLICDALREAQDAEIAFSPGFRWGTSLLPGTPITREGLLDQVATTYSYATVSMLTGAAIKDVLEDVCDNLFNPDPYYQQGGDMVRTGGLSYACEPGAPMGRRIHDLRLNGRPLDADRRYKVAGWAPVSDDAPAAGLPMVWDVIEPWLKAKARIAPRRPNVPRLIG